MHVLRVIRQEQVATGDGDPARASRPFDQNRTGMVLGEGAGAVVLEELSAAQTRGATIYGEVLGQASSSAADRKLSPQRDHAMKNVLASVLNKTRMEPQSVGHLNAHGLSTRVGDVEEAWAINHIFGHRTTPLPVVTPKSYFGNLGAGSGMVEMAASLLCLIHGRLFAALNYETSDPECPLAVVTDCGTPVGDNFVSLNVTPQGQASAVAVGHFAG
jgi:3-oxoacyl-[acyl-carrier-protein] synthase II